MKSGWRVKAIHEPAEYRRTKTLNIESSRAVDEWCDFFEQSTPVTTLILAFRCPQRLFDAACLQEQLTSLHVHWGPVRDLSSIRKLRSLERLYLGSCSIKDVRPISALKNLQHLSLNNLDRMSDYSPLGKLKNLELLEIDGAPMMPKSVWIDDLKFLRRLPNLRGLSMFAVRFRDSSYYKSLRGLQLEHLNLWVREEEIRHAIIESLPNLKSGSILKE